MFNHVGSALAGVKLRTLTYAPRLQHLRHEYSTVISQLKDARGLLRRNTSKMCLPNMKICIARRSHTHTHHIVTPVNHILNKVRLRYEVKSLSLIFHATSYGSRYRHER